MKKSLPKVALVGRINAGKSTLFNTLTDTTNAITSPTPGTTRDLNFATLKWRDKTFSLVDTGGLDAGQLGEIETYVQAKAYQAIKQADLILYIIDGRLDLIAEDKKIARYLKRQKQDCLLVINKIDGSKHRTNISPELYKLGLGQPLLISAISGVGTGDLLDEIVKKIRLAEDPAIIADINLSIIGKTNVGKSSILNAIIGDERAIVTPIPHTTREPQDTLIKYKGLNILLVDTAGMRKKRNISDKIERYSVAKTREVIKKSDISIFVIDISKKLSSQDQAIGQLAHESHNGIIITANKWDLIKDKTPDSIKEFTKYLNSYFPWLSWAPIIFTSALIKQRTSKLLELALRINHNRKQILADRDLIRITGLVTPKRAKPSMGKKAPAKIYLEHAAVDPPVFRVITRHPDRIHHAFLNLLEKKIRSKHNFAGTPIIVNIEKGK